MFLKPANATLLFAFAVSAAARPPAVTFSREVLPILEKHCQECHRPGEAAPFPLLTYEQARPWAKAMKEAVLLRKMPPWFADPHYGKFSNDRSLSQDDILTLASWADQGAPQGDPKDAPPPIAFIAGWRIPQPDMVIEMPKPIHIPASGTIQYQHVVVPAGIAADRWVQCAEVRPGNRALVHHIVVFIREPGSAWLKDAKPGVPFVEGSKKHKKNADEGLPGEVVAGYTPGLPALHLPPGQAILLKAGSDIVFQLHYTANGKAGTDRSRLGLVFTKEPPKQRLVSLPAFNDKFKIPAGDANYRVDSFFELGMQAELTGLQPHMHSRGKDFEFHAVYPNGKDEILLRVPNYSFSWQLSYDLRKPIVLPKGTRIECTAHFDNSPNNPDNPDSTKEVSWGDQSWDEMMIGFFSVVVDVNMPVAKLYAEPAKPDQPRVKSQQELDALRVVQTAQTPGEQIQAIENVLTHFPDTTFKIMLLQKALDIERSKGDFAQTTFYGERLLSADPKNAFGLVTLALETARHIREFDLDKADRLAKVEGYAKAGLDAAKVAPKPRADMTDERWEVGRKYLQSQAYEALGRAAALRKKYDEAVLDYKQALSTAATPDAATWMGLGQVYEDSGKLEEASAAFDQALASPNVDPHAKSEAQAKKDEVAKRKRAL